MITQAKSSTLDAAIVSVEKEQYDIALMLITTTSKTLLKILVLSDTITFLSTRSKSSVINHSRRSRLLLNTDFGWVVEQ